MGYQLGIDLGTSFTAMAIARENVSEPVSLGQRSLVIPSVVFAREDGTLLVGDSAARRGAGDPTRLAREFKRRLGDATPILIGGAPYSPQALMAALLRYVLDDIESKEGAAADHVTLTHPANWGPFKLELFDQVIELGELVEASTVPEPLAAALYFASTTRVKTGEIIALYDLGGGTFDSAVLVKTADSFAMLGSPLGIEHLGGIDFDEAVFGYVTSAVAPELGRLDLSDSAVRQGFLRLRHDCVEAKEILSSDTEVSIPVSLPGVHTEVRLTRSELEGLIRPALLETVAALRRVLRSAQLTPEDVSTAVLVGGSSRIPKIAELLSNEVGVAVAVGSHPELSAALGAAKVAALGPAQTTHLREREHRSHAGTLRAATKDAQSLADIRSDEKVQLASADGPVADRARSSRRNVALTALAVAVLASVALSIVFLIRPNSADDGPTTRVLRHDSPMFSIALSSDGTTGAAGGEDGDVTLWRVDSGAEVRVLSGVNAAVWAVQFAPDGATLASGSVDHTVRLWDVETGELFRTLRGHTDSVWSLAFSPSGAVLASASGDSSVNVWDVASGTRERTLMAHTGGSTAVAFSPQGTLLATAGRDATVKLWDAATGALVQELTGHDADLGGITSLAFSPDGALVASAGWDGDIRVWNASNGDNLETLSGHTAHVWSVAFSPDGAQLASASEDTTVKLWDVSNGDELETLRGHTRDAVSVAFSPEGTLASASSDETVRVWDVGGLGS